ncbi:MFS transporter [Altererythrobacter sp. B11]|uniref:MFS transporter n=1 Tax=Altererythrobacter sp. B11 TaxID=2060312 RepID=UPI000DC73CD8|nr:MFS transporter [Altererythrobacter sp. B11]BBC74257.1 MFS transporter [Altererythrobacter sp. B11]
MLKAIGPVRSLLLAIFMLMAGSGFMGTLLGVRLERGGNSALVVGVIGTAYFLGLVFGSLKAGGLVSRVGHIRAFAAFVSLFSASTLSYAVFESPPLWAALRLIDGFCVAGVYVCLESWLNERADSADRGTVLAGYMISLYIGQALGQFLLNLSDGKPSMPFLVASILISLAAIPVALTRISAPAPESGGTLSVRTLYEISPLGVVGATITGLMLGAFYALGSVYARRMGMELSTIAIFMSTVIFGGVALQWPLGLLSDRFDRRRVIVIAFGGTLAAGVGIALIEQPGLPLLALAAIFGGLSFALYPLCVAHANDHLSPEQRVAASGGLVLAYSAGAAAGPMAGASVMTVAGAPGLFLFIATCAGCALLFGLWRQARTAPVPAHQQQSYQVLPRTTPVSAALDPRAPEETQETA